MSNRRIIVFLASLAAGGAAYAGPVLLIDDKADFVGQFTVIDFESRGDGTPIVLNQTTGVTIDPNEYAAQGVTITVSSPQPLISNDGSQTVDAAQALVGSPTNELLDSIRHGFVRFDFDSFVNAVGLSTINRTDTDPVILEIFNSSSQLLASISFDEEVLDGTVRGADFGEPYDFDYGFFGAFAPDDAIAYAILSEDATGFDDLHFGVIPEPPTAVLLLASIFSVRISARCSASYMAKTERRHVE